MIYPHTFEEKIGMTDIRQMLKAQCLSPLGEQRTDAMTFITDCALLKELHQQVGEFARLMEEDGTFPDEGYYDLRPTLHRIRIEGTYIETEEMFALKRSLETIVGILRILGVKGEEETLPYPALARLVRGEKDDLSHRCEVTLTPNLSQPQTSSPTSLIRRIDSILDKFGKVKDNASRELAQIRRELANTQGSISRVLNGILRAAQAEGTVASDVNQDGSIIRGDNGNPERLSQRLSLRPRMFTGKDAADCDSLCSRYHRQCLMHNLSRANNTQYDLF